MFEHKSFANFSARFFFTLHLGLLYYIGTMQEFTGFYFAPCPIFCLSYCLPEPLRVCMNFNLNKKVFKVLLVSNIKCVFIIPSMLHTHFIFPMGLWDVYSYLIWLCPVHITTLTSTVPIASNYTRVLNYGYK